MRRLIRMRAAAAIPFLNRVRQQARRPPIERRRSAPAFVTADGALVADAVSARAGIDSRV